MFSVICYRHVPLRYELDIQDEGTTLIIRIPHAIWQKTLPFLRNRKRLSFLQQRLRIPPFLLPGPLPWGFGPVFILGEHRDSSWVTVLCELPQFFSETSSAESEVSAWNKAYAVTGSLEWVFTCLQHVGDEPQESSQGPFQLLEVQTGIDREDGRYIFSVNAGFSLSACRWIESQARSAHYATHALLTNWMTNAYKRLYGKQSIDTFCKHELRAEISSPCRIHFSVPGDRTGLGSFTNHKEVYGLELYDHNVDNTMQQLVILVGVAGLHSLARKAGY